MSAALLANFRDGGFSKLIDDDLRNLATYLEAQAMETQDPVPLLLAEALFETDGLFRDEGESGGIQVDFVNQLDRLALEYFAQTKPGNLTEPVKLAEKFRDEITKRVNQYSPRGHYD